jgi:hypothetical protein
MVRLSAQCGRLKYKLPLTFSFLLSKDLCQGDEFIITVALIGSQYRFWELLVPEANIRHGATFALEAQTSLNQGVYRPHILARGLGLVFGFLSDCDNQIVTGRFAEDLRHGSDEKLRIADFSSQWSQRSL